MRYLFLFLMCLPGFLFAQNNELEVKLDTNSILIGERARLIMQVELEHHKKVYFQAWPDSVDGIELSTESTTDTLESSTKSKLIIRHIHYLTSFDSGYFVIPPLYVVITDQSRSDTLFTDAFLLRSDFPVVDTTDVIHDIYDPYTVPYTFVEILHMIWPYLAAVLALVLLIFMYRKYYLKRDEKLAIKPNPVDPFLWSKEQLDLIRKKDYPEKGMVKDFHVEVTEVLRTYLELQFNVPALERTSDDLMSEIRYNSFFRSEDKIILENVLKQSDSVKFAKFIPNKESCDKLISDTKLIIENLNLRLIKSKEESEEES